MEQAAILKRLYVGGLDHTVSEAELRERFGKFGKVTEIEFVTRKDEEGMPTKTFAYINITLSEKELKKCISIFNKTKWKGGMLQIELAKESFLHRLARERQEASLKREKLGNNGMADIVESMKKSGVENFHVKAVPGTEVPNHKDWVVSKFGRVLPILQLKNQHKNKIIKYDPSKYCHNLKKLDQDLPEAVPISQLTWHLEEKSDSINKKRQGQFSVTKTPPEKKMRIQNSNSLSKTEMNSCCQLSSCATKVIPTKLVQNHTPVNKKHHKMYSDGQKVGTDGPFRRKRNSLSESDMDSEEEVQALIVREREVNTVSLDVEPEDSMEIVGDNFELKYSPLWFLRGSEKVSSGVLKTAENKTDYDSADTDEIIAVTKTPKEKEKNGTLKGGETSRGGKDGGSRTCKASSGSSDLSNMMSVQKKAKERAASQRTLSGKVAPKQHRISSKNKTVDDKSSASCSDMSESEEDGDYETLMQSSCYRLDLTLQDLKQLASKNPETTDEDTESHQSSSQDETQTPPVHSTSTVSRASTVTPVTKKGICPEEILSAILMESSDEEKPKKRRAAFKIQPFRGIGSLCGMGTKCELSIDQSGKKQVSSDHANQGELRSDSSPWCSDSSDQVKTLKSLSGKEMDSPQGSSERFNCCTSNAEDSKAESTGASLVCQNEPLKNLTLFPKRTNLEDRIKGHMQNKNSSACKSEETFLGSAKATNRLHKEEKQLQDNEKRLTALQERQKEREQQKKLIQGALTNLETQSRNKQKHIVFDSDSENEDGEQEIAKEGSSENPGKEFILKTSGNLFESSDDESNTTDEEDNRFRIKPQFEGKAGEKLMHLQSRFGTDERFRMDARFLESDSEQEEESKKMEADEEEELALEKKKNLEILKNLIHIDVESPKSTKPTASAKRFKDMNALRYDPTRQDHEVFEKKQETSEKESKAKEKKKREEAKKLPEVSKEMFYDVSVDLKEVFGSTKPEAKPEVLPWDKHDEDEQLTPVGKEAMNISAGSNIQEESSGFTFSFFGVEEEREPVKEGTEPYIIETIKPSKIAWQEDPRFQDSSSEDDEPEVVQSEDAKETLPVQPQSGVRFFFFSRDDDRLKEGPKLFCKSSDLDEDRDYWETRHQMLLEDCRKKHKDARRKVKAKQ